MEEITCYAILVCVNTFSAFHMTGLQSIFVAIDNTTVRLWHIADAVINS